MRGVFDIDVTQPELQSSGVVPRVREQMPTRMSEHVRMCVGQPCAFARSLDHLRHIKPSHGAAALGREHKRALRLATQFAQRPQFIALDRMHRRGAAFEPADVEVGAIEVDLIPLQIDRFGDPQSVPGH